MTNCIFCGDTNKKLGIDIVTGVWHCFRGSCEARGIFTSLYAALENISYEQADIRLTYRVFLKDTPKPVQYKNLIRNYAVQEEVHNFIPVKPDTDIFQNDVIKKAWLFLIERKLFNFDNAEDNLFFAALEGFYKNRVIIPYTHDGTMIYFQARSLFGDMKPKYLCASEGAHKIRGADILYPFNVKDSYVVVCEGPIDAKSLQLQGVNATCTTGTSISETQINALQWFKGKIVMGYDNDKAGLEGIRKAEILRKKKRMSSFYICHPPPQFKDWGESHCADFNLKEYVEKNTYECNFENVMKRKLELI